MTSIHANEDRTYDLTVFGATGYTGRLVLKYLNELKQSNRLGKEVKLCFAGRDIKLIKVLSQQLCPAIQNTAIVFADVVDEASIYRMASDTRVVLSCVVS